MKALCEQCHREEHMTKEVKTMSLREWQSEALSATSGRKRSLVVATPGAGKTVFAAHWADARIKAGEITAVVVVVPSRALISSWQKSWAAGLNIQMKSDAVSGNKFPKAFDGVVVTYAKLVNMIATIRTWVARGERIAVVFDEIHHSADAMNSWGVASQELGEVADCILSLTGTPFRSDGHPISWVDYDSDGVCRPSYEYLYGKAVSDGVCRPVEFLTDDGELRQIESMAETSWRISETGADSKQRSDAVSLAYNPKLEHLPGLILGASRRLDIYRMDDPDAACLIVCRPGVSDDDDRHVFAVRDMVKNLTGEDAVVVTHDEDGAHDSLEVFRNTAAKFLISVRMVSEGIDIPRLRVLCLATAPTSKLLFQQLVGRVVRVEPNCVHHNATVVMSKFPWMAEWAEEIEDAVTDALQERLERKQREKELGIDCEPRIRIPLSATHEGGGAISAGETFSHLEILAAILILERSPAQLRGVTAVQIAVALRVNGQCLAPQQEPANENKEAARNRKRSEFQRLMRQWFSSARIEPGVAYRTIFDSLGVKNTADLFDNKSIDVVDRALAAVARAMQGGNNAA
jgi:superfamily II DNA or RNA helicase